MAIDAAVRACVVGIGLLLSMSLQVSAQPAPTGWSVERTENEETFEKRGSDGAMTLKLRRWRALSGGDLATWVDANWDIQLGPEQIARRLSPAPAQVQGSAGPGKVQISVIFRQLKSGAFSMLTVCARDGRLRIADLYGSEQGFDDETVRGEAIQIVGAACLASAHASSEPEPKTAAPRQREQSPQAPNAAPKRRNASPERRDASPRPRRPSASKDRPSMPPVSAPQGLKEIWYLGYWKAGAMGANVRYKSVLLFDDGAISEDHAGVFSEGAKRSQTRKPEDWGRARIRGDELTIKWSGDSKYTDYSFTLRARAGGPDQRLEGCFTSKRGYTLGVPGASGSISMSVASWCFDPSGRFSNDKNVSVSGSGGGAFSGSAEGGKSGWYRIDGYAIALLYDDGTHVVTSFATANDDHPKLDRVLLLGSGRYVQK